MGLPYELAQFETGLHHAFPTVVVKHDAPSLSDRDWWIDIKAGDFSTTVAWREGYGFGVFTSELGYGDKPDEVYRSWGMACRRVRQLADVFDRSGAVQPMRLREIRTLIGEQQESLAEKMRITQAAVSKFEGRRDVKLSTVASYVGALGGRVEMRVVFDHFEATVPVPAEEIDIEP